MPDTPPAKPVVNACSGCSDPGELADRIARRMAQEGLAEMSCFAGIGGRVGHLLAVAEEAVAVSTIQTPKWAGPESTRLARWTSDVLMLTKARANAAVVATTLVGFALHTDVLSNWLLLFYTLAGTSLLAGSAAIANQAIEQQFDRTMERTRNRPIAAGRLSRRSGIWLSSALCGAGVLWLGALVNVSAMLLGGLAFLIYVLAYTPMKRRTPACMLVGAVSGAIPFLVGWAATGAPFGLWSAVPFAILLLWQVPHFLAIAWWHRAEYFGAGYRMLPHDDRQGYRTAAWAVVSVMAILAISLVPEAANLVGPFYWPGALALGIMFSFASVRFFLRRDEAAARSLFLASLYYLPAIYSLMLLCKEG